MFRSDLPNTQILLQPLDLTDPTIVKYFQKESVSILSESHMEAP